MGLNFNLFLSLAYPVYLYVANIVDPIIGWKLFLGLVVGGVNLFLGMKLFRDWAVKAIALAEETKGTKRNTKSAVIFDLDNTLVDTYSVFRNAKLRLTQKLIADGGKIVDEDKFVDELFKKDRELCLKYKTNNYDQQYFVKEACEIANLSTCDVPSLTKEYEENLRKSPQLFPKALETLAKFSLMTSFKL